MKIIVFIVLNLFCCFNGFCQIVDSINKALINGPYQVAHPQKAELFNNGFIDFMNNGQMNASARLFKLYLGEPAKFVIPISLYTGVSANNFNNSIANNQPLVLNLINPLSGVFNISLDATHYFLKQNKSFSKIGIQYQAGERLLSYSENIIQTVTFMNGFLNAGLIFQTGAWEKNKVDNMGVFWISPHVLITTTNKHIKSFLGSDYPNQYVWGYSIGIGIEINRVLNIKGYYYRYLGIENKLFAIPIFHFSFNYSMHNP